MPPPLIVTGKEHRFLATEQLRKAGVELGAALLEPIGRSTAPALTIAALAATGAPDDPILVVTPSDQTAVGTIAFVNAMQVSIREAATSSVVILGITPGMQIRSEGQGVKEKGYWQNSSRISHITSSSPIVAVDDRYFRPTEFETLLGDPTKARDKLGWMLITFDEPVAEMVREDLKSAQRYAHIKSHGHKAMDYHE